jgi:type IV secretory pathway VirB10-like protein
MRDKQAVDAYKADIKSQLTSAGLVHGLRRQPTNTSSAAPAAPPVPPAPPPPQQPPTLSQPQTRSRPHRPSYHQNLPSAPAPGPSSSRVQHLEMDSSAVDYTFRYLDPGQHLSQNGHATNIHNSIIPELTGTFLFYFCCSPREKKNLKKKKFTRSVT